MKSARMFVAAMVTFGLVGVAAPEPQAQEKAEDKKAANQRAETKKDSKATRQSLIARAEVWRSTDIASMNLKTGETGPGSFAQGETVTCDYMDKKLNGASPKFACRMANGEEIKVKYGGTNGEVYGEVAASRLLWALGFGADQMYSVKVVCRGCPPEVGGILRVSGERLLDPAAVERKMPGEELLDAWKWDELEQTDPALGGASRAERDALKLLAVMLQHSDSKPDQQRLLCLDDAPAGGEGAGGDCKQPFMMINDLGITFGRSAMFNQQPRASVNLAEWRRVPVWKDAASCVGNLSGSFTGTLKNPVISEEGRAFLSDRLNQLSDQQLVDMFEAARIHLRPRAPEDGRSGFPTAEEWAGVFKQKRAEIAERRCAA